MFGNCKRPRVMGLKIAIVRSLLIAIALAAPGTPAMAQVPEPVADEPGRVLLIMEDGRRFQGELIRQDDMEIVLLIADIETKFKAEDVMQVVMLKTFREHYEDLKSLIPRDDYVRRFQMCEWIYRQRRLEIAAMELEDLLDDNPRLDNARELLRKVNAEIELMNKERVEREANPGSGPGGTNPHDDPELAGRLTPTNLLTDDQLNIIRVYEIDVNDPPRLIVRRDTIDRLFDRYGQDDMLPLTPEGKRAYYRKEPIDVVRDMFALKARDLYGEIRVLSEPKAMNAFRLNVHRVWLANSCATTRCHGGTKAGSFFLFSRNATSMNTVYTNFLILERSKLNSEPMINYDRPERSPLLHLGLPRNRSLYPHPDVDGWRPVFRDEADPLFTRSIEWMRKMYVPRPEYPIEYQPPFVKYELEMERTEPARPDPGADEAPGVIGDPDDGDR